MKLTDQPGTTLPFKFEDIISKLPRRGEWKVRRMRDIVDITIHHTAAPVQSPQTIANWHVGHKGWPAVGYHYLVYPDGSVFQCNEDLDISYHNGFCNRDSIGVCLVGNFEVHQLPLAQWVTAINLVLALKRLYPSIQTVTGHREYKGATLCPGKNFDLLTFRSLTGTKKAHPLARRVALPKTSAAPAPAGKV